MDFLDRRIGNRIKVEVGAKRALVVCGAEELPAQAQVEGQARGRLEVILEVDGIITRTEVVGDTRLSLRSLYVAQQEILKRSKCISRG